MVLKIKNWILHDLLEVLLEEKNKIINEIIMFWWLLASLTSGLLRVQFSNFKSYIYI